MTDLEMAKQLWSEFGDVPIDDNDCITCVWRSFNKGTNRFDVWHWFEDFFEVSVAKDLMDIEGDGYKRYPLSGGSEKAIKALEQDWISTRERLPELNINIGTKKNPLMISDPVYITIRMAPKDTIGQNVVCPIPCILSSNGNWYVDGDSLDGWVNIDDYDSGIEDPFSSDVEVVAWRPVLEPYKEIS